MKKTLAILLIAVLALGSVFAAFNGSATVEAGYDIDNKAYGFLREGTGFTFNVELATEAAEKKGEGDVYASIKAAFEMRVLSSTSEITPTQYRAESFVTTSAHGDSLDASNLAVGLKASISEAKVVGSDWYVSILNTGNNPDYAKSTLDSETAYKSVSNTYGAYNGTEKSYYNWILVSNSNFKKNAGVEIGYKNYKAGVGLYGEDDDLRYSAYVQTPEFDFEGLKVQAAAVAYSADVDAANALGASAKASYKKDKINASVAADLGYVINDATDNEFNADVAVKAAYDFATVDAYYATKASASKKGDHKGKNATTTKKDLLSAQAVVDLKSFDVPATVTVYG